MRNPPFWWRAFLISFIPVALALAGSTWAIQVLLNHQVKEGLRDSLRRTHAFVGRMQAHHEGQNRRMLSIVTENPSLKAGIELVSIERQSPEARRTLEDQLHEFGERLGFDILVASDADGEPLAAVCRGDDRLSALAAEDIPQETSGVARIGGRPHSISTFPVLLGDETIGLLTIGRILDLSDFTTATALTRHGKLIETNLTTVDPAELEEGLAGCEAGAECDLRVGGELFLSMPFESLSLGDGYELKSLQSVDVVEAPLRALIRRVSLIAGSIALVLILLTSLASSKSIVRPIATLSAQLENIPPDGVPPTLDITASTQEVGQLVASFNRASVQIREARSRVTRAHTQFIEAMTNALDARDVYTLGHSRRVSEYALLVATRMGIPDHEIELIRVGGLLHDIGKIGVPDAVLRKPGKLTKEEFDLIKQHPTIGRRIVENIDGFSPYIPIIELHHENFDGSGYPKGLPGPQTPLLARIVHVVDAYDAMTSVRPYRNGMTHEEAASILVQFAGTQFDPDIVREFLNLGPAVMIPKESESATFSHQIGELGRQVGAAAVPEAKETSV